MSVESLYPFLYATETDVEPVLADVARSTREKAAEIVALRETVLDRYGDSLEQCAAEMAERFAAGGKLLVFGNGGSSADAQEVATSYLHPEGSGRPLPALSLSSESSVVTALANDVGYEVVFARQLAALGRSGDIAMGISTSGGSANVLKGFDEASRRGMLTVGLAGNEGGRMAEAETIDHLFVVPSASIHRIQEAQTTIYHVLRELVAAALPA